MKNHQSALYTRWIFFARGSLHYNVNTSSSSGHSCTLVRFNFKPKLTRNKKSQVCLFLDEIFPVVEYAKSLDQVERHKRIKSSWGLDRVCRGHHPSRSECTCSGKCLKFVTTDDYTWSLVRGRPGECAGMKWKGNALGGGGEVKGWCKLTARVEYAETIVTIALGMVNMVFISKITQWNINGHNTICFFIMGEIKLHFYQTSYNTDNTRENINYINFRFVSFS